MVDVAVILIGGGAVLGIFGSLLVMILRNVLRDWAWPIRIPLLIQRGDGFVWDVTERAKVYKTKAGFEALKLMKRNHDIRVPEYRFVTTTDKGKQVYPLFSPIDGQYSKVNIVNNFNKLGLELVEDKASKNWAFDQIRRTAEKYRTEESWLQRNGMFLMTGTFAAMVIFFVIYYGGKLEMVGNSLAGAADSLAVAMTKFATVDAQVVP